MNSVQGFLDVFVDWLKTRENIIAAALVGSYARDAAKIDSDVDLVILPKSQKFI